MKVLILGATGRTGGYLVQDLIDEPGIELLLYVRSPQKIAPQIAERAEVIAGDVLDTQSLSNAVQGCDWVVACLAGDALGQARSIAAAVEGARVQRVAWLTGVGVQAEVPGPAGEMLAGYARRQPEFVEAAKTIHEQSTPSLLVRAPFLTDGAKRPYALHRCGEEMPGDSVSRATLARFMADAILGRVSLGKHESLGPFDA